MQEQNNQNKLKERIFKSIIGLIIVIVGITFLFIIKETNYVGKIIGFIFYYLIISISLFEFTKMFPFPSWVKFYYPLLAICSFFFPFNNLIDWFQGNNLNFTLNELIANQYIYLMWGVPGLGYGVQAILCLLPFFFMRKGIKDKIKYYFMIYFIVIMLTIAGKSVLYLNTENLSFLIVLLAGPVICDTFAFFGGLLLGGKIFKRKLAPKISPNKTIEGAICGFLITWFVLFMIFYFTDFKDINIDKMVLYIVIPITLPIIAIFGDLLFSYFKRIFKTKDYSNLIPGHGGMLDRLDSIVLSSFILISLFIISV